MTFYEWFPSTKAKSFPIDTLANGRVTCERKTGVNVIFKHLTDDWRKASEKDGELFLRKSVVSWRCLKNCGNWIATSFSIKG